jgi:hypothetical protein
VDAATRERLGEMFCGWYFRRDELTPVIDFAAGGVPEDADPARVRDVACEVMQERLATAGVHADGTSIWIRLPKPITPSGEDSVSRLTASCARPRPLSRGLSGRPWL